jgi:hypothetical protein
MLTSAFASYLVGQDLDKSQSEQKELLQALAAAKAERDRMAAKLGLLSARMDELLLAPEPSRWGAVLLHYLGAPLGMLASRSAGAIQSVRPRSSRRR